MGVIDRVNIQFHREARPCLQSSRPCSSCPIKEENDFSFREAPGVFTYHSKLQNLVIPSIFKHQEGFQHQGGSLFINHPTSLLVYGLKFLDFNHEFWYFNKHVCGSYKPYGLNTCSCLNFVEAYEHVIIWKKMCSFVKY
ncbi:hypothetical protein HanIR_Chr08g0388401 [Helianthus annuus]|nr:hypothetical protein HanIR_Chr08g0388401 [Helianthus annuus]